MSKKLTDWFPADVKPVHIGVYETDTGHGDVGYQYWNGANWRFWGYDVNDAYDCRLSSSCFQKVQWRGLAKKP